MVITLRLPVYQLDLKLLKADQMTSPLSALLTDEDEVDGIRLDRP